MKKNTIRWWVVLAVILVVFTVLAFALPFPKTAVFAVSYLFGLAAIAAQIYVIRTAFYQGEGIRSKFYGFPIARVGGLYLAAQLILSLVSMALALLVPLWLPLVLSVVLAGAAVVGFIGTDVMRDEVVRQDKKQEKDVSRMRAFQAQGKAILSINALPEQTASLEHLAEALRYSDPVSSEALTEIEENLAEVLTALQKAVAGRNADEIAAHCQQAETILTERNQLCKLHKK